MSRLAKKKQMVEGQLLGNCGGDLGGFGLHKIVIMKKETDILYHYHAHAPSHIRMALLRKDMFESVLMLLYCLSFMF